MKPNRADALACLRPVQSSFIQQVGFKANAETGVGVFYIQIKGKVTAYEEVPIAIGESYKNAPSFGVWYNANIKGKFTSTPVEMEQLKELLGETGEREICSICGAKTVMGNCPNCDRPT